MSGNNLVDGIIEEPIGGAHAHKEEMFERVKQRIIKELEGLDKKNPQQRIDERIEKFCAMGVTEEIED